MNTKRQVVPIHDITYKMNDILNELDAVKRIAVDQEAVQRTIDQVLEVKKAVSFICCQETQGCGFEVVNERNLKIAV